MSLTVNGTILNSTSCVSFNGSSIATIWACDTLNNTCCKVWSTYNETDQFSMRLMSSNTGTNLSLSFDEINSLFNSGCTTACCSISNILFANGKMNTIICLSSSAAVSACENTNGTGYLIVCADSTDAVGYTYDVYAKYSLSNFKIYDAACSSSACRWSEECLVRTIDDVSYNRTKCLTSFTIEDSAFCCSASFQYTASDTDVSSYFQNLSCVSFDNSYQQLTADFDMDVYFVRCDGICIPQYRLKSLSAGYLGNSCSYIELVGTVLCNSNGALIASSGCWYGNLQCMIACSTYGCL